MSQSAESTDGHARWVATWREAVRASPLVCGLVELATARFIELSPGAAELFGTTPERAVGLDYLSLAERPREAAETFRLARQGMIEGIRARRRHRRSDGSTVEVESCGVAIRSSGGPDLGLWVAVEVRSEAEHAARHELVAAATSGPDRSASGDAQVTLDERWRVAHIDTESDVLLGRPLAELLALSIIELTHPDDLAALLLAFARAGDERSAHVRVRLRHRDGSWRMVEAVPTVLELDGTSRLAFTVAADEQSEASGPSSRATGLAEDLRRIADQIEAAGVLAPLVETAHALRVAATAELSPRQWEVVSRLVRGERVATIAAEMYLSQSTVRNHLSAIFHKVGVHSQQELLALWRTERTTRPSIER